jgi:hypothetical protein
MEDIVMDGSPTLVPSIPVPSNGESEHSATEDYRQHPAKKRKVDHSPPDSVQESPNWKDPTLGSTSSADRTPPSSETSAIGSSPVDESSYDSIDVQPGQKRKLTTTRLQIISEARWKEREAAFAIVAQNVYGQLRDEGYILLIEDELSSEYLVTNI